VTRAEFPPMLVCTTLRMVTEWPGNVPPGASAVPHVTAQFTSWPSAIGSLAHLSQSDWLDGASEPNRGWWMRPEPECVWPRSGWVWPIPRGVQPGPGWVWPNRGWVWGARSWVDREVNRVWVVLYFVQWDEP
jgi:hypothetical protein